MARGSEQDHDHVHQRLIAANFRREGTTVHAWHHHVDDRDVELIVALRPPHLAQRLHPTLKAALAHTPRVEVALEDGSVGAVVVDDCDSSPDQADRR